MRPLTAIFLFIILQNIKRSLQFCQDSSVRLVANDNDCGTFFICDHGEGVKFKCPKGTLFDTKLNLCNFAQDSVCARNVMTTTFSEFNEDTTIVAETTTLEMTMTSTTLLLEQQDSTTTILDTETDSESETTVHERLETQSLETTTVESSLEKPQQTEPYFDIADAPTNGILAALRYKINAIKRLYFT